MGDRVAVAMEMAELAQEAETLDVAARGLVLCAPRRWSELPTNKM